MTDPATLLAAIDTLTGQIESEAQHHFDKWSRWSIQPDFVASARNLAAYLALRHHDLRKLQRGLIVHGLSSLGRAESRVMPALAAVRAALVAMDGGGWTPAPNMADFHAGEDRLEQRARRLFGPRAPQRHVALMVTCPTEAADDPAFLREMARRGVEAIRINCAHDDADAWLRMIRHAHAAGAEFGRPIKVFVDLAGPKIRTGKIQARHGSKRVHTDDRLAMVAAGGLKRHFAADIAVAFECTLAAAIGAVLPEQRLVIDDGKIALAIDTVEDEVVTATVTRCHEDGVKLKPEKGINLPDTDLDIPALTDKDCEDLAVIAHHADGIEFSFVQRPDDVLMFQDALAAIRPDDWQRLPLVLKIETARAIRALPDILVCAGARQPVAIMIARGDLAVEIGFPRMAEMQEEIMWIAEAAQVPVIWATQVLEQLVKEGLPTRGELTDAAMGARAEAIMLNKGPYLVQAIDTLDQLLGRMEDHLHKKSPSMRSLKSW